MSPVTAPPQTGQGYWRSLEQLQETPEFVEFLHREFPVAASEFPEGVSRRRWLQLMGASFALSGLVGCWENDKLLEFSQRPANRIPGVPQRFATSWELGGVARPLLVTCYDGRPIKVEGNPDHPQSLGGSDMLSQAMILNMYDPDRSRVVQQREGEHWSEKSWDDFSVALKSALETAKANGGSGLRILAEPSSSATRARLQKKLAETFPSSKWVDYEPINRDNEISGAGLAFGQNLRAHYDLAKADVILSLDADLFGTHPAKLVQTRQWSSRRTPETGPMNRTYVVESQYTTIGTSADHRLAMKSSDIGAYLAAIEKEIDRGLEGKTIEKSGSEQPGDQFLAAVAADLVANKGKCLVAVGSRQPATVHARAHRINSKLGNIGATVTFTAEPASLTGPAGLASLAADLKAGTVELLVILGGNPAYASPGEIAFGDAIGKAKFSLHLSDYPDETSLLCHWALPEAHEFEGWNDGYAYDGTYTLRQPLIAPLFDGRTELELLASLVGEAGDGEALVKETAKAILPSDRFEKNWRKLVHDGFWVGGAAPVTAAVKADFDLPDTAPTAAEKLELVFVPSPTMHDGRFANNGWMQETPDPLTKVTWDNAAILAPKTADKLGVKFGSMLKVSTQGQTLDLPVYVLPGQAIGSIGLALGYGRTAAGKIGGSDLARVAPVGQSAYPLTTVASGAIETAVEASVSGAPVVRLSTTQDHFAIDTVGMKEIAGRIGELVREGSVAEYKAHPDFAQHKVHHPPLESLWEEKLSEDGRKWGMSIDLSKCIGCNACVTACQAENNIPIVGKEQVRRNREMHWIRVDRYFKGDVDQPQVVTQPVTCHQCENAPCEQVCPVAATTHSPEGLNDMAYNRCIGTRYCGNNCPYKVRRFNYFDYNKKYERTGSNPYEKAGIELTKMVLNPEVTVRERGVMEKCTYCIQRIAAVRIPAKNEQRPIRDGEIVTACQQACPAQAIVFGDLNDAQSVVKAEHDKPRAYAMLAELNVKPRTKYLARIRNPHPWLANETDHGHGHDAHA